MFDIGAMIFDTIKKVEVVASVNKHLKEHARDVSNETALHKSSNCNKGRSTNLANFKKV